jgi:hypothetical protein
MIKKSIATPQPYTLEIPQTSKHILGRRGELTLPIEVNGSPNLVGRKWQLKAGHMKGQPSES